MSRHPIHIVVPIIAALMLSAIAHADPPQPPMPPPPPPPFGPQPPMPPGDDPIGERVFPPDLIMSHQADIGLDDKTRNAIVDEIQKFQSNVVKIQWDLKASSEQLAKLLDQPNIDETKVLAQADKVMALEHDMKKAHLTLLIHLKNKLTPDQQQKLRQLRGR